MFVSVCRGSTVVEYSTRNSVIEGSNAATDTRAQCNKTFLVRTLQIFILSQSVCHW